MKISFSNDITANSHSDFGLLKQEVSQLLSEKTFLLLFSLNMREKCIVNDVGWKIPNDINARDSHLEETEYTGS